MVIKCLIKILDVIFGRKKTTFFCTDNYISTNYICPCIVD